VFVKAKDLVCLFSKKLIRNGMFLLVFGYILFIHLGPAVYFHGNSSSFNSALGIVCFSFSVFMHWVFLFNVLFAFGHMLDEVHPRKSYLWDSAENIFSEHMSLK